MIDCLGRATAKQADQRSGLYKRPLPFTAGQDAIGTIVSLPKSGLSTPSGPLPALEVGQTVLTCEGSAFAEYMVAPWHKVAPLPDSMDRQTAVCATTTAFTAMYLVKESYEVKKGDWVLVRAAAGGVGLLLCQVSYTGGAMVAGCTLTPAAVQALRRQCDRRGVVSGESGPGA